MKIIFLDIDGPVIPSTMILIDRMASFERIASPMAIAVLNELCKRTDAKIVFNTTHNIPFDHKDNIDIALIKQGLKKEYIHEDKHTKYPSLKRNEAVNEWLQRHPETEKWIALDDVKFTTKKNLILVDYDSGLTTKHLNIALKKFGANNFVILL